MASRQSQAVLRVAGRSVVSRSQPVARHYSILARSVAAAPRTVYKVSFLLPVVKQYLTVGDRLLRDP